MVYNEKEGVVTTLYIYSEMEQAIDSKVWSSYCMSFFMLYLTLLW